MALRVVLKLKEYLIYLTDWIGELILKTMDKQEYNDAYFLLVRLHKLNVFNLKQKCFHWCACVK